MKNRSISILSNIKLLYFVFFLSLLNVIWLVYNNKIRSIIIFASCCLVFYLINKNMIFVLGLSLIIVNITCLVSSKEGYKNKENLDDDDDDDDEDDKKDEKDEKEAFDEGFDDDKLEKLKKQYKKKVDELDELDKLDEDEDEESMFTQDKALMKKIKKFDPIVFNTIKNLNPVDIDKINKTINELINKLKDP